MEVASQQRSSSYTAVPPSSTSPLRAGSPPAVLGRATPTITTKGAALGAVEDVLYGSLAGIAGKYIEFPFDTVKVRLQSQPSHQPPRYTGALDCFRQGWRTDGFTGLYRGISAPLVGAALETSSLFLWEQAAQKTFFATGLYTPDRPLPLQALWLTGAISGIFTSLVLTPVELVKCKMQVPAISSSDGIRAVRPTPWSIIRAVYKHHGLRGFWHGQTGTLIRETGGCAFWFGAKETTQNLFRNWDTRRKISLAAPIEKPNVALPVWQQAVAGGAAGVFYNVSFFPADTIKSRMQTEEAGAANGPNGMAATSRKTFWREGVAVWRMHGIKGLYRGVGITAARAAPSSAFIFIIYDALKARFPLGA